MSRNKNLGGLSEALLVIGKIGWVGPHRRRKSASITFYSALLNSLPLCR
jgi:hypothetical protein